MIRCLLLGVFVCVLAVPRLHAVEVAFGEVDITPEVGGKADTVWIAGYGPGRAADGVHDPIMARCVVLKDGEKKIALVSVDLVGMQLPDVKKVRAAIPGFDYVMVCSTHNHEGPDVVGLWGRTPFHCGVNDKYMKLLVERIAKMVTETAGNLTEMEALFGTAEDANLLKDSRLPKVLDPVLRALVFRKPGSEQAGGILVQWNCHPEALGSKNRKLTSDFVGPAVAALREHYECPVAYFTGTVGGLLAPPSGRLKNADGVLMKEGMFEFAKVYGEAVADLARKAVDSAELVGLSPFSVKTTELVLPASNMYYRVARATGVLTRDAWVWEGDPRKKGAPLNKETANQPMAIDTEVSFVRLGQLSIAGIPGELYPELVYGKFQEPADPGADFPGAALEPTVAEIMPTERWMLFGLANDEVGYLIPKRQWDARKPYAYGREKSQYGEINSCGPESARLVMEALAECVVK